MADVGTSNTVGGTLLASGSISTVDDLYALDAQLPRAVPLGKAGVLVMSTAVQWPGWVFAAGGLTALDDRTVTMRFEGSIGGGFGVLILGALKALVSGFPPNPVHDAMLAGSPITWQIRDTSPSWAPVADAAGGAAKQAADAAGGAAKQVLEDNIPWMPILIVGGAILLLR